MEFLVCSVSTLRTIVLGSCRLLFLLHQTPGQKQHQTYTHTVTDHYSVSLVVV